MQDDETTLVNYCTDLVSLKRWEEFPLRLLTAKRSGEWVGVCEFCREIGALTFGSRPQLFATWLPDPTGNKEYAVVMFYDDEWKWSMAAHYNRQRLLADSKRNQALEPAVVGDAE